MPRLVNVVYIYARQDERLRDELERQLSVLDNLISQWHDRDLKGGDPWRSAIDQKLQSADLILLMVSADFFSSTECQRELSIALHRLDRGESVRVVPVILKPTAWKEKLGRVNALPADGAPIALQRMRGTVWAKVVVSIREIVVVIVSKWEPPLPPPSPAPKSLYVICTPEDRTEVRRLVRSCREQRIAVRWDRDWVPWSKEYPKGTLLLALANSADAVVFYGSESLAADPFYRDLVGDIEGQGKAVLLCHQDMKLSSSLADHRRIDFDYRTTPAEALIRALDPVRAAVPPSVMQGDVDGLLDQALQANQGIPTDTITERIFLTEDAAELTKQAFRMGDQAGWLDYQVRRRADLEYARLLRFCGRWNDSEMHLANSLNRDVGQEDDLHYLLLLEYGSLRFERGLIADGIHQVQTALAYFEDKGELNPSLVKSLRQLGNMIVEQGDWGRAEDCLTSAVALAQVLVKSKGSRKGYSPDAAKLLWIDCKREHASFNLRRERVVDAIQEFGDCAIELEALGEIGHHLRGVLYYHLGRAHVVYTGELRKAEDFLLKSLDVLGRYDNPVRLAFVYENIARVRAGLLPRANTEELRAYLMRALQIRHACGHAYMEAKTWQGLGDLHFRDHEYLLALQEYRKAEKLCSDHNKIPELAHARHSIGKTYAELGKLADDQVQAETYLEQAKQYLRQAKDTFRKLGLSDAVRAVQFNTLNATYPQLLDGTFEDVLRRGRDEEYEFRVNEVGEYAVHSFIRKLVGSKEQIGGAGDAIATVPVGIGDDAAVLRVKHPEEYDVVLTTDAAPGFICRSREVAQGEYAAKFSVIHSLSDLLAMGATPVAVLLNLYMVRDAKLAYAYNVIKTVKEEAEKYRVPLIGGDIKEREEQSIGCVGVGLVPRGKPILRSGAEPGHVVAITQASSRRIGKRWAAEVLENWKMTDDERFKSFFSGHDWKRELLFLPYNEMLAAAATRKVRSAIDTSDGLMACLQLIGRNSKVSFVLDQELVNRVIDPDVVRVAQLLGLPLSQFLFNAGHDWEIVMTIPEADFTEVQNAVRATHGDISALGRVIPQTDRLKRGIAYKRLDGSHVFIPFFTDEKFVLRPYHERALQWEELRYYIEGGEPLKPEEIPL